MTLWPRRVGNGLVNRAPVQCPVCARYVATFDGVAATLDDKAKIIYFVHPGCCPAEELPTVTEPTCP